MLDTGRLFADLVRFGTDRGWSSPLARSQDLLLAISLLDAVDVLLSLDFDVSDRLSLSTNFEWNIFSDDVDDTLGGDDDDDDDLAGLCRLVCEFRDEFLDITP
jgi:hypothetical protein